MAGYGIGAGVAIAVAVFARRTGLDRERAFYTTVAIVVSHYYVLFAAMAGATSVLVAEAAVMALFIAVAVAGFRAAPMLVAAALAGHGVFDAFHTHLIANPGVPAWWPAFCLSFDVVIGLYLACVYSQLSVGMNTWLCRLPWLPPMLVPPPDAQITPSTNADP
jgi:hypothetical protein